MSASNGAGAAGAAVANGAAPAPHCNGKADSPRNGAAADAGTPASPASGAGGTPTTAAASVGSSRTPVPSTPARVRKTDRYGFFISDRDSDGDETSATPATPIDAPTGAAGAGAGAGAGSNGIASNGTVIMETALTSKVPVTPAKEREKIRLENQRTEKWRAVMKNWASFTTKKKAVLKRRIRKGIPEALRGTVWPLLVGSDRQKEANASLYTRLLHVEYPGKAEVEETIERDISRTFPRHAMFAQQGGLGQAALERVLHAYAAYDQEVGYCQGMGFITAMFLSYMPEEDAFFLLLKMLKDKRFELAAMYRPGMPMVGLLHFQFHGLMKKKLPKLCKHLDTQGLHPTIFASQWFITVFTYSFQFSFSTRVWDCFLYEGWKICFRVGLALLKMNQQELLAKDFEGIMTFLHNMPKTADPEAVLKAAFKLNLKRVEIDALGAEYRRQNMSTVQLAHATTPL